MSSLFGAKSPWFASGAPAWPPVKQNPPVLGQAVEVTQSGEGMNLVARRGHPSCEIRMVGHIKYQPRLPLLESVLRLSVLHKDPRIEVSRRCHGNWGFKN